MSFPRYEQYKDSGVEWLGEVPAGWAVKRLRFITDCLDGKRVPLNSLQRSDKQGVVPYWGANSVVDYVDEALFDEELVLLGEDGAPFFDKTKSVAFCINGPVWPNNHIHVLRPKYLGTGRFMTYVLNVTDYAQFIDGSTRDKLTQSSMSEIPVPWPSYDELYVIAAFLDRETAKIDALIAEQQRLIALLAEKRQAVISHAVTKGLNPDAPMKDSGIEWLGEVPVGWEVTRLGNLFKEVDERGNSELPVLCVSIHSGISDRELDEEEMDRKVSRSEDRSIYKQVRPGDLVYNMMRAWQGAFGAATVDGMVSPAYVVARPRQKICTTFVELMLRTPQAIEQMRRYSKGVTDFRLRLYWDEFKNITIALPTRNEAEEICKGIRRLTSEFDALTAESQRAVALLQERRTALISATVTGKIDVRGVAPQEAA